MLATRARSAGPFFFIISQHYLNLYSLVHTRRRFFVKFCFGFFFLVEATLFAMPAMRAMSKSLCVLAVVALTDELLPPVHRSLTKP
jgi:hypothetical protein